MFPLIYTLLLFILVMFSWIASVYGFVLPDGELIPSLLSSNSLRWFVRHSIEHIASAPLVYVLLVLIMMSAIRSCGVVFYVKHLFHERRRPTLVRRQQYAARIAWLVFLVCLLWVLWGVVSPIGNLLSVTGRIAGGPLASGWLFLLFVIVCVPCLVYGLMTGLWHTPQSILKAFTTEIARCSDYFVTFVITSQLMAALHYTQMFQLLGWGSCAVSLFTILVYGVPLVSSLCRK